MLTLNVLFTECSVRRLLPLSLSLLQGSGVRLRLVANACAPNEVELLRAVAGGDERIAFHALPVRTPIPHGTALDRLFEAFPEPRFAFADSDVFASGDFTASLELDERADVAAVFAAPPVWLSDEEATAARDAPFLSGRYRTLADGTPIGGTHFAVYERAALEPRWREARGFSRRPRLALPRYVRASLAERGWDFSLFDTGRVVNLLLLRDGFALRNRDVPDLHHVGGFTSSTFAGAGAGVRNLVRLLRLGDEGRLRRAVDAAAVRAHAAVHRRQRPRAVNERRRIVLAHVDAILGAISAGETPSRPATGSDEVDSRVAALVEALQEQYPRWAAALPAIAQPIENGAPRSS
jgi:hypothetical protein